jgi:hypothetical protein
MPWSMKFLPIKLASNRKLSVSLVFKSAGVSDSGALDEPHPAISIARGAKIIVKKYLSFMHYAS